jgi:hypothetical protein
VCVVYDKDLLYASDILSPMSLANEIRNTGTLGPWAYQTLIRKTSSLNL